MDGLDRGGRDGKDKQLHYNADIVVVYNVFSYNLNWTKDWTEELFNPFTVVAL